MRYSYLDTPVPSHYSYLGNPIPGHYCYLGTAVSIHCSYLGTLVSGHYSYLGKPVPDTTLTWVSGYWTGYCSWPGTTYDPVAHTYPYPICVQSTHYPCKWWSRILSHAAFTQKQSFSISIPPLFFKLIGEWHVQSITTRVVWLSSMSEFGLWSETSLGSFSGQWNGNTTLAVTFTPALSTRK